MRRKYTLLWILVLSSPAAAVAADSPAWVRVSFTSDPSSTMTISWNTKGDVRGEVDYGPTSSYGLKTAALHPVKTPLGYRHTAVLKGLTASSTYHYRVGNRAGGYSRDYTFVTAPSDQCAPFSFAVLGDGRGMLSGVSGDWQGVLSAATDADPAFVLVCGDFVYDGKDPAQWARFLDASVDSTASCPLMGTLGNHDDGPGEGNGANYNRIFEFPRNSSTGTIDFYSFDYGSAHVVSLSTETFKSDNYKTQAAWLDADLSKTDRLWKIVFLHRPVYSSGGHGNDDGRISPYLTDILEKHRVDIVMGGHDHDYERFKPIRGGTEVPSYSEGTLHIVTGGAGAPRDAFFPLRTKHPLSLKTDNKNHYIILSVDGRKMHVEVVRVPGGVQGGVGTADEFDITKSITPDPCAPKGFDGGYSPDAGTGSGGR